MGGGIRKSEVFHIYDIDISLNKDNKLSVRVYHPAYGVSPDPLYQNREEFLRAKFQLKPRHMYPLSKRLFAGWKDPLLTSKEHYFEVIFSSKKASLAFREAYTNYLLHQRVDPPSSAPHPYAFTNQKGEPETIKNFQRLHKLAVERIGLTCLKNLGTTEHAHRHSYGYRLVGLGFTPVEIQKAMHHKNIASCLTYIQSSNRDLWDHINLLPAELK